MMSILIFNPRVNPTFNTDTIESISAKFIDTEFLDYICDNFINNLSFNDFSDLSSHYLINGDFIWNIIFPIIIIGLYHDFISTMNKIENILNKSDVVPDCEIEQQNKKPKAHPIFVKLLGQIEYNQKNEKFNMFDSRYPVHLLLTEGEVQQLLRMKVSIMYYRVDRPLRHPPNSVAHERLYCAPHGFGNVSHPPNAEDYVWVCGLPQPYHYNNPRKYKLTQRFPDVGNFDT